LVGFIDDYIKVFKKDKEGLKGKIKIIAQVFLGLVIGSVLYFHPEVVVREKHKTVSANVYQTVKKTGPSYRFQADEVHSTKTTIPFVKNNEFDYAILLKWLGDGYEKYAFLIFIPVVIFIITGVSNGANLTDGMDGLAAGTSAIIGATLGVFAWVSGNIIFADYLNIMYIPNVGELSIFIGAFVGATVGFLWYNTYPAQVFMGDTGSLAIGGIIAVFAIIIRKELLLPLLAGIFVAESISVILQVSYFKYTRKKYGTGRRIFLMSPLHHHFQKKGFPEPKIVMRFFIVGVMLAVLSIVTLKLR
jgi:phospho-N-acetylmuramoyl-pentapeptide-transferase